MQLISFIYGKNSRLVERRIGHINDITNNCSNTVI